MTATTATRRLVHLVEGACTPRSAKTSRGVLMYSPHQSIALIDSTNAGRTAAECLEAGGDIPVVATLAEALRLDPRPDTLVLGITPVGGRVPESWRAVLLQAIDEGLDIWNGLHEFLGDDAEFRARAASAGTRIWDVRKPPPDLPVGAGRCRDAKSCICLFVGTDCAIGKMTAALELCRQLPPGVRGEFVGTGQTGMMVSGWGHPVDAIPGDFMAGAVEKDCLAVDGKCDVIFVEGQGALQHPGFSSVTLALLHGACPDCLVLCHQPSRREISKLTGLPIPPLREVAAQYVELARFIKPTTVVAVCLNTLGMSDGEARAAIRAASGETGLPACDPVRYGAGDVMPAILESIARKGGASTTATSQLRPRR